MKFNKTRNNEKSTHFVTDSLKLRGVPRALVHVVNDTNQAIQMCKEWKVDGRKSDITQECSTHALVETEYTLLFYQPEGYPCRRGLIGGLWGNVGSGCGGCVASYQRCWGRCCCCGRLN